MSVPLVPKLIALLKEYNHGVQPIVQKAALVTQAFGQGVSNETVRHNVEQMAWLSHVPTAKRGYNVQITIVAFQLLIFWLSVHPASTSDRCQRSAYKQLLAL